MRSRGSGEPDRSRLWLIAASALVLADGAWNVLARPCFCDATADITGRVVAPDGGSVSSAVATLSFRSRQESATTDSLGCFHIHFMHSPNDGRGTLSVTRPGMKPWTGGAHDVAVVRLVPATSAGSGEGEVGRWADFDLEHDATLRPCSPLYAPQNPPG